MCLVKVPGFNQFKIPGGLSVVVHLHARLIHLQLKVNLGEVNIRAFGLKVPACIWFGYWWVSESV